MGDLGELLRAVVAVTEGGSVIDPQVVEGLLARGSTTSSTGMGDLTERETDVLREMVQGKSNQAIAETLFVSESAVEKHINAILAKLGLDPDDSLLNRRVAAGLAFLQSYDSAPAEG